MLILEHGFQASGTVAPLLVINELVLPYMDFKRRSSALLGGC